MKKTHNRSIFPKLLISYFLYALIAVAIVIGGVVFLLLTVMGQGDMGNLIPSEMVTESGELRDEDVLYQLGGWAERLYSEHNVTAVYGEQAIVRDAYTNDELLELTGLHSNEEEFHAFYKALSDGGMMIYIPTEQLRLQYTYEIGSTPAGTLIVLLVLVLLILEGVFISRFFYRKIKHPVTQLSDAMQRMENGEREIELDFRAEGEFIRLRDAFNRMIRRLAEQEDENLRLQQAQQKMILELAHDIRTPISTIVACASALEEGIVAPEDIDGYYETIASKAGRVSAMADDMFTMLKMGSAEYQQNIQQMDICEFMRRIGADYYNDAMQHDLEMVVDIPETEILINADKTLLYRAIGNLISNAIKYNHAGSMIGVLVRETPDKKAVAIHITDDGDMIDPEFVPQMFQPFSRADKARRTDGGTGLGLTIAKSIVEKQGGTIRYSYADGKNDMAISLSVN